MNSKFEKSINNWTKFGGEDPLWAILSKPGNNKWELEEFFETGSKQINQVFEEIDRIPFQNGDKLIIKSRNEYAGKGWISYRYFVMKMG